MMGHQPQLRLDSDVLLRMVAIGQEQRSLRDTQRGPEFVTKPAPHEGVRRALLGSFGSIPAMPEEFVKLLDRLR
jgi:hypothetical protein